MDPQLSHAMLFLRDVPAAGHNAGWLHFRSHTIYLRVLRLQTKLDKARVVCWRQWPHYEQGQNCSYE